MFYFELQDEESSEEDEESELDESESVEDGSNSVLLESVEPSEPDSYTCILTAAAFLLFFFGFLFF